MVRRFETMLRERPQLPVTTYHLIHGGMCARTITIPKGAGLTGAQLSLATILIVDGDVTMTTGDTSRRLTGYHVLAGSAGRKQGFIAHADTHMTCIFKTLAQDVESAELELTGEHGMLCSHFNENIVTITGET